MVTDYRIVYGKDSHIEQNVKEYLADGWKPLGCPVYANCYWHQAMIKESDEREST